MKTVSTACRLATRPVLAAAFLLTLPLAGMHVTDQVFWTLSDFVIMGVLVVGTGFLFEIALVGIDRIAHRAAAGLALATAFLLIWVNGAVGIIGSAGNDANLMYGGVLAVGIVCGLVARFEPRGMARALFATALAQALVALVAIAAEAGSPASGPLELMALNGVFVVLWGGSALLFLLAAREHAHAASGAPPRTRWS